MLALQECLKSCSPPGARVPLSTLTTSEVFGPIKATVKYSKEAHRQYLKMTSLWAERYFSKKYSDAPQRSHGI